MRNHTENRALIEIHERESKRQNGDVTPVATSNVLFWRHL
jgi:hypothetical protein